MSDIAVKEIPFNPLKKIKSKQDSVAKEVRLELIILIVEFGLSCYTAAKVLDLSYCFCKQIYRRFRAKKLKTEIQNTDMLSAKNSKLVRKSALRKLSCALKNGSIGKKQR